MRALGSGTPQMEAKYHDNCGSMPGVERNCMIFLLLSSIGVVIILSWWYTVANHPGDTTTKHDYWSN